MLKAPLQTHHHRHLCSHWYNLTDHFNTVRFNKAENTCSLCSFHGTLYNQNLQLNEIQSSTSSIVRTSKRSLGILRLSCNLFDFFFFLIIFLLFMFIHAMKNIQDVVWPASVEQRWWQLLMFSISLCLSQRLADLSLLFTECSKNCTKMIINKN